MPSDDLVARLRNEHYKFISVPEHNSLTIPATSVGRIAGLWRASADEIERLREHVRALEIEIERYRIQCVRISDLERMLEVQDTQLEHAQRALRILEGHKHEQQG